MPSQQPSFTRSEGYWGVGFALMGLVKKIDAAPLTQDDCYGLIDVTSFPLSDLDDREATTIDPTDVVFDSLQTGNDWPVEREGWEAGHNFRWNVPGALCPKPNENYQFLIEIPLLDGEYARHIHVHTTYADVARARVPR